MLLMIIMFVFAVITVATGLTALRGITPSQIIFWTKAAVLFTISSCIVLLAAWLIVLLF